ncbi:Crp/Fnr family transcriptional regulator [Eleftheria terrae]|uniref:Crp/Fnr family transcriptional regulator n=1 Tax=Eleftheria terrae TaxID=1597781 RepID=UPI00263B18E3|nr:Crp/Fnr family transcriptional regulator [Eleftheria terrae]WKB53403.1 Crp/Fnr family transcriptional regulator [Eleftheria terrae]
MPPALATFEAPAARRAVLLQGRWFAGLPGALQDALLERGRLRQLAAGERLFLRGDPPCGLYAVLHGAVCISGAGGQPELGKEALLTILEPPLWFGEIALFDRQPRTHDAVAHVPSVLLQVPQAPLLEWLEARPDHWRELGVLVSHKLRQAFLALEDMALLPAPQRLARRLVRIAEGQEAQAQSIDSRLRLSQQQLSSLLSLTRQTTNQILKDFEKRGLLRVVRGGIEVLDLAGLRGLQ